MANNCQPFICISLFFPHFPLLLIAKNRNVCIFSQELCHNLQPHHANFAQYQFADKIVLPFKLYAIHLDT